MESILPDIANSPERKEFFAYLKNKLAAGFKRLAGENVEESTEKLADDYFYRMMKPKIFWGSDGAEAEHERGYESACVILSQRVNSRDPKIMTVIEFMMTLSELKRQSKQQERRGR